MKTIIILLLIGDESKIYIKNNVSKTLLLPFDFCKIPNFVTFMFLGKEVLFRCDFNDSF